MLWSDEVSVMFKPTPTYERLRGEAAEGKPWWVLLRRPLLTLFIVGWFVSMTSAGRLVVWHTMFAYLFWGFLPLYQVLVLFALLALFRPTAETARSRLIDLYYIGNGPWYAFMLLIVAICLFSPSVYATFTGLLRWAILPALLLFTLGWSIRLSYVYFRRAVELSRGRAALATLLNYLLWPGLILGYYLVTYQIQSLVS